MPHRMLGLALLALALACSSRNPPPTPPEDTMSATENPARPATETPARPATESPPRPAIELTGKQVTISDLGEFTVGHSAFRLHNAGGEELVAVYEGLWLDVDGQRRPLALGSIFDQDRGQNLDPAAVRVAPGQTLTLLIGFPPFVHEPGPREQTAVVVRLRAGAQPLEASSPLLFVRRIPRRWP